MSAEKQLTLQTVLFKYDIASTRSTLAHHMPHLLRLCRPEQHPPPCQAAPVHDLHASSGYGLADCQPQAPLFLTP